MKDNIYHTPIFAEEIISFSLNNPSNKIILDATCGEGGHSELFLKHLNPSILICMDRNKEILDIAKKRLNNFSNNKIIYINDNFINIDKNLNNHNIEKVDIVLADLGISMFHLKQKNMGFSYNDEFSLDMRLDNNTKITAKDIVNTFEEKEISDILYQFGEEIESKKIAKAIINNRPINNALELSKIIAKVKKIKKRHINPATQTFQALRIYVNNELDNLRIFLDKVINILNNDGLLFIITFHSLEDRIVKYKFKEFEVNKEGIVITKKVIKQDYRKNRELPSGRSAKLRIFKKIISQDV